MKTIKVVAVCSFPTSHLFREFKRLCALRDVPMNENGAIVPFDPKNGAILDPKFWQIMNACEGRVTGQMAIEQEPKPKPRGKAR